MALHGTAALRRVPGIQGFRREPGTAESDFFRQQAAWVGSDARDGPSNYARPRCGGTAVCLKGVDGLRVLPTVSGQEAAKNEVFKECGGPVRFPTVGGPHAEVGARHDAEQQHGRSCRVRLLGKGGVGGAVTQ